MPSNDWLYAKISTNTVGAGLGGASNATGRVDVMLTNTVRIDNANIAALGGRLRIFADNGGSRPLMGTLRNEFGAVATPPFSRGR